MNIQFVRLEHDVCDRINQVAREEGKTVSDLVNDILREHFARQDVKPVK